MENDDDQLDSVRVKRTVNMMEQALTWWGRGVPRTTGRVVEWLGLAGRACAARMLLTGAVLFASVLIFGSLAQVKADSLPSITTLISISPPASQQANSTITISVSVTNDEGFSGPIGNVEIRDAVNYEVLGSAPVVEGLAQVEFLVDTPIQRSMILFAAYGGDLSYAGSVSQLQPYIITVPPTAAPTTTSLNVSTESPSYGESVTFTATVTEDVGNGAVSGAVRPANGSSPTGTVQFVLSDGVSEDREIGQVELVDGVATFSTNILPVGTQQVFAKMLENENYLSSISDSKTVVVGKATTTTEFYATTKEVVFTQMNGLGGSVNPVGLVNQSIAPANSGPARPTGTVTIRRGNPILATATLEAGSYNTSLALPFGEYELTATYSGDENYVGSTSRVLPISATFALGSELKRLTDVATDHQAYPEVASLPVGGVLAWRDLSSAAVTSQGIMARVVNARGRPFSPASRIGVTGDFESDIRVAPRTPGQALGGVAGLTTGDFVVTWQLLSRVGATTRGNVFVRRFASNGTPRSAAVRIATPAAWVNSQPVVAALPNGRFVVAWQANGADGSGAAVAYLIYDAQGRPVGLPRIANATTVGWQGSPVIDTLSTGGFVIGWTGTSGQGAGVFFRPFAANGAPIGGDRAVTLASDGKDSRQVAVSSFPEGGFAVAWEQDETTRPNAPRDIFYRVYANTGAPVTSAARANTATFGDQRLPTVTAFEDGSFAVGWTDGAVRNPVMNAQMFNGRGVRQQTTFTVNENRGAPVSHANMRWLGGGSLAMAVWMTWNSEAGNFDLAGRLVVQASGQDN